MYPNEKQSVAEKKLRVRETTFLVVDFLTREAA
jgi:hypothetical protein